MTPGRKVKRPIKLFVSLPMLPEIRIRVARQEWGMVVEYVGPSPQHLHAAGCVTDRMLKLWASGVKGGKKFRDENGDGFRRWPRPSRAYPQGVHVTRNIHHERNYRALPGVADCLEYLRARREARPIAQINTLQVRP